MKLNRRAIIASVAGVAMSIMSSHSFAEDVLRVGAYPANPPWENKTVDGNFEGFEVDIVNEVAKRLGKTTEIKGYDFRALFVATASGRADVIISSLTITNERLESQSFTQPYIEGALAIGVKDGSDIDSIEDLKGKKIGTIATSFPEAWVNEREDEIGFASNQSFDTTSNMLTALQAGRIDAVVNDVVALRYYFNQMSGLNVSYEIVTGEKFAMMLPKGSPMLETINNIISEMKEDGTMGEIYKKWLGTLPAEDSLTVTALPVPTSE